MNGFVRDYNRFKNLALFGSEKYDTIFDGIRDLVILKSGTYVFFSNYAKGKIHLGGDLSLQKHCICIMF